MLNNRLSLTYALFALFGGLIFLRAVSNIIGVILVIVTALVIYFVISSIGNNLFGHDSDDNDDNGGGGDKPDAPPDDPSGKTLDKIKETEKFISTTKNKVRITIDSEED